MTETLCFRCWTSKAIRVFREIEQRKGKPSFGKYLGDFSEAELDVIAEEACRVSQECRTRVDYSTKEFATAGRAVLEELMGTLWRSHKMGLTRDQVLAIQSVFTALMSQTDFFSNHDQPFTLVVNCGENHFNPRWLRIVG